MTTHTSNVHLLHKKTTFSLNMLTLSIALCCSLGSAQSVQAEMTQIASNEDISLLSALSQQNLVQALVKRNAQIIYTQMQMGISAQQVNFEKGVFESEFYTTVRNDSTHTLNTATESLSRYSTNVFDEKNASIESGLKTIASTGAEVKVGYQVGNRTNNIIPMRTPTQDTERSGSVVVTLKQPLLRGWGNQSINSKIEQAKLDQEVSLFQYKQQLLRTVSDGLTAYWQLYRAKEIVSIRTQALDNARKTANDVQARLSAGRSSSKDILEAKATVASREAELQTAFQLYTDSEAKVRTLLNIQSHAVKEMPIALQDLPVQAILSLPKDFNQYYEEILKEWPSYLISKNKALIESQNIIAAEDEKKSRLDMNLGYTTHGLTYNDDYFKQSWSTDYPSWYVSLDYSVPLNGNERATAKENIAKDRKKQNEIDLEQVKVSLANDLKSRMVQAQDAYKELQSQMESVKFYKELLLVERVHFDQGLSRLSDLYLKEDKLNLALQRHIDAVVKYELSKIALQLAEGSLLKAYNVDVTASAE